ncbi:MAG: DUF4118 domain-containing protein [Anaerolineae bacterium]|nr:DUF4118 domain-containing protein [Anaerolineae bacterium]
MKTRFARSVVAYLESIVAVAITTLILLSLEAWLSTPVIALLFLLPVILASTHCGLRPALVASTLAFFAFNYFFIDPRHTLIVQQADEFVALLVFLGIAVLISRLVTISNEHARQAQAREFESTTLYHLSKTLSAEAGLDEILSSAAREVTEVFDLAGCEILLPGANDELAFHIRHWVPKIAVDDSPPMIAAAVQAIDLPLTVNQVSVGILRLMMRQPGGDLAPETRRLLTTFAAQLGSVVERARLAREATRARLLEESDRLKSALLSSVSHDLRTPLAAIKASATTLLQDVQLEADVRRDLLSTIDEEADRLNRLVGDLLDMSRIEGGALRLKLDWCDLDEMIRAVVRRLAGSNAPQIQLSWPANLPLVYADYVQLDRVMTNLLENALHFAPPGSTIGVTVASSESQVTVSVSNEGPTIPEQTRAHLFGKFYRISEGYAPDAGTGLGLSICKGIVEAHDGRIWVESPITGDGRGAQFVFTLPLPADMRLPDWLDDEGLDDEKDQNPDR